MSLLKEEKRVAHDQDERCLLGSKLEESPTYSNDVEEVELYPHDTTTTPDSFEFIRIRYQTNDASNQARIFRNAFNQIKRGGWLEVLENLRADSAQSSQKSQYTALQIKQQLIDAGFVDVEEKVWQTSKPSRQKTLTLSSFLISLCSTFFGLSWKCPTPTNTTPVEKATAAESTQDLPSFFVIGRKP